MGRVNAYPVCASSENPDASMKIASPHSIPVPGLRGADTAAGCFCVSKDEPTFSLFTTLRQLPLLDRESARKDDTAHCLVP